MTSRRIMDIGCNHRESGAFGYHGCDSIEKAFLIKDQRDAACYRISD